MDQKNIIKKVTGVALDALVKFTKADIRLHGKENIPAQPSVFVINHFTRMETFFLPYLLIKNTGREILSLAHHSFFYGNFGKYIASLGAVSTRDPQRDRIFIGSLLKGDKACMIFPEGQMIKDKKIVEKGKYIIYNSGIRRPPHTGAGIMALKAEYFRLLLRHLYESGKTEDINAYASYFNLGNDTTVESVINQETYIVPINITYFPIRVRNNIINKLAHLVVDTIPERIEEELEVEGTMLTGGVDIDINFGEPIPVRPYLLPRQIKKRARKASAPNPDSLLKTLTFRKTGLNLMYRYMNSIYNMTTVNHDHIFAFILNSYKKSRIPVSDFKNRAFLAIDHIRHVTMQSHHTNLKMKQNYLLSDDTHGRYDDFMDAAKSDGLIYEENGCICKNRNRFSRPYEFHTIRRDNIIEVLKNEVEPVTAVVHTINRIMMNPTFMIRRKIRNMVYQRDMDIFNNDYKLYFKEGESKPPAIGRPIFLKHLFNKRGILLIHGYMAAPEEIRALANYLYGKGYAVYGVRLRGHGTSPEDLAGRKWEEWYESVNRGYVVLKNTVKYCTVAGFSTGGGLALHQAVNKGKSLSGVISINAPLKLNNIASRFASTIAAWNSILERFHMQRGKMDFVNNEPENRHINYFRNPINGVYELEKCMADIEDRLKEVSIPSLIIQGSHDPVVNPESGLDIFDKIGTSEKEICRVYSLRHGIVNGDVSDKVFRRVHAFLEEVMP